MRIGALDQNKVAGTRSHHRGTVALTLLGLSVLALLSLPPRPAQDTEAKSANWLHQVETLGCVSGDLIFRRGRNLVSRVVLAADGGSEYSHVGLVSVIDGRTWVIHAVPPEEPDEKGGVIAERLSVFLSSTKATAAGLYRPRVSGAAIAERTAWSFARDHVPFDSAFDLSTPDKLYCTEMVWRSYREAGVDLTPLAQSLKGKYLLPSDILHSPSLRLVQAIKEKEISS